jgi:hypothetical protein
MVRWIRDSLRRTPGRRTGPGGGSDHASYPFAAVDALGRAFGRHKVAREEETRFVAMMCSSAVAFRRWAATRGSEAQPWLVQTGCDGPWQPRISAGVMPACIAPAESRQGFPLGTNLQNLENIQQNIERICQWVNCTDSGIPSRQAFEKFHLVRCGVLSGVL